MTFEDIRLLFDTTLNVEIPDGLSRGHDVREAAVLAEFLDQVNTVRSFYWGRPRTEITPILTILFRPSPLDSLSLTTAGGRVATAL